LLSEARLAHPANAYAQLMSAMTASHRDKLGPFFVPMLRIGIIQLELIVQWIKDCYAEKTVEVNS
jgi:hypothetical protein